MGTTSRGFRYPESTDGTEIWNYWKNLADDVNAYFDGTTGTWTPTLGGWTLSGSWTGTYRRVGDEVTVAASITLTANASGWPTAPQPDSFQLTGLPYSISMLKGGAGLINLGLRPWVVSGAASTLYVNILNKTGTLPQAGTTISLSLTYYTTDPV